MKKANENKKAKANATKVVETVKSLIPKSITEPARIQKNMSGRVVTGSTNGKLQQRSTGPRVFKNSFGHIVGTIGAELDQLISNGNYTKNELAAYAGTKLSKVNSHIRNELVKKLKLNVVIDDVTKKVSIKK